MGHEHDWIPIPLSMGRYACACGATGFRSRRARTIVAHKKRRSVYEPLTARTQTRTVDCKVAALPTLDEAEKRR